MNRRTNDQILDAVAGDFIVDQTDIRPWIMVKVRQEKGVIRKIRMRQYALLSLIITLLILIVSVPEVSSAMRQLFGFLPGIGLIDPATPVRVLNEPVQQERNGVIVTIEQLTALPDRTVIQYRVSGIPQSAYPNHLPESDAQGFQRACIDPAFIRLPDGTALTYSGYNALSGTVNVPEYKTNFTVKQIPADIDQVTLVVPCIEGTERDAIPGAWEFKLRLIAMPENMQLLPVSEIPSPSPPLPEARSEPLTSLPAANIVRTTDTDIRLTLDKVVSLPDGDQLYGSLQWGDDVPYSVVTVDSYRLTDARSQQIPITQVSPDPGQVPAPGSRVVPLAFKVGGPVQQAGLVTLTVDRLTAFLPVEDSHFIFDTGLALNEDGEWLLNQDIQTGPYSIRVVSAKRLADGYEFSFQTGPEIGCVDVYIQGTNDLKGMCGQGITRTQFDGNAPDGVLTVIIANLEVHLSGSWQVTWQPPETVPPGR